MRLIDADALFELIKEHDYMLAIDRLNSKDYGMFTSGIKEAIDLTPTVEPMQWISVKERFPDVVRCKECKHGENNCYVNGLTLCKRPIYGEVEGTVNTLMAESDFCSYGERK